MQHGPERSRLLEKLVREVARAEAQAIEHAPREHKRIGDTAPVFALREIATHATAMRSRFDDLLHAYDIQLARGSFGATLATLRHLVVDRVIDAERAYRTALLDLRHGMDMVRLLREVARGTELFGVIRWCDDWHRTRRTLVASAEAHLSWFVEASGSAVPDIAPAPVSAPPTPACEILEGPRESGAPAEVLELK